MSTEKAPARAGKLHDLDKAADPIQRAQWSKANVRIALRNVRIALESLHAVLGPEMHQDELDSNGEAYVDAAAIRIGDRVSLAVSEEPDDVTGTVLSLYDGDDTGDVAVIELWNGVVHHQCVRFLTRVDADA
jgi:hypothetical protein